MASTAVMLCAAVFVSFALVGECPRDRRGIFCFTNGGNRVFFSFFFFSYLDDVWLERNTPAFITITFTLPSQPLRRLSSSHE